MPRTVACQELGLEQMSFDDGVPQMSQSVLEWQDEACIGLG